MVVSIATFKSPAKNPECQTPNLELPNGSGKYCLDMVISVYSICIGIRSLHIFEYTANIRYRVSYQYTVEFRGDLSGFQGPTFYLDSQASAGLYDSGIMNYIFEAPRIFSLLPP
jgi:hypothetical protein